MEIINNIKRFRELKNLSRDYIAAKLTFTVAIGLHLFCKRIN